MMSDGSAEAVQVKLDLAGGRAGGLGVFEPVEPSDQTAAASSGGAASGRGRLSAYDGGQISR